MVTVYAWYPWEWYHFMLAPFGTLKVPKVEKTAGHATMMYYNGYISLWVGSRIGKSFSDDIGYYQVLPHRQVSIPNLDEQAIHSWWEAFKHKIESGSLVYSFGGLNCAKTVALALDVGSGGRSRSWHSWNAMWSPKDAIQFAEALRSG